MHNCKYYHSDLNNIKLSNKTNHIDLGLLHLNIRSIPRNLNTLIPILHSSKLEYNIIALSETWLKQDNVDSYGIAGFKHEYLVRDTKAGGGISMFFKDSLNYKLREDLTHIDSHIEMLWVELDKKSLNTEKNVIMGTIYRIPGSDPKEFNEKLNILTTISRENKQCIHTGDYNLNLLNATTHIPTNEFVDINFSHSLYPIINKPTRITPTSATIIDNIFINTPDLTNSLSGIIIADISDHYPVFYFKFAPTQTKEPEYRTSRTLNASNKLKFTNKLSDTDWTPIFNSSDLQYSYTLFHNIITSLFNETLIIKTGRLG
jgi:hypothetical protein